MDRLPAGGDAAPLVNGHVHNDRAGGHALNQLPVHQCGGAATGGQHGADQQIRRGHQVLNGGATAHQARDPATAFRFQLTESDRGEIQENDLGIHGRRDAGCAPAHGAGPQHHHPRRLDACAAPDQHPAAPMGFLQQVGPHLGGQTPGNLAHGGQQRQAAVLQLHGFIGNGGDLGLHQGPGHRRIARQVQIGEQHQVFP